MRARFESRPDRLRALCAAVLETHAGSVAGLDLGTRVQSTRVTSTGVAVVMLGPTGGAARAVLKLPLTAPAELGLEREGAVLSELRADPRLGSWNDLLPRPLAHGVVGGRRYRVDAALGGRPLNDSTWCAAADGQSRRIRCVRERVEVAADTIFTLHRATATTVRVGEALAERWIDAHVEMLVRSSAVRRIGPRLERLRAELRDGVIDRELPVSWVHGDFWLGNVLASSGAGGGCAPAGIVDWETAGALEHPLHDLLHLLLYTRRLRSGRELGPIVRRQIERPQWLAEEQRLIDRYAPWWGDGSLSHRHALLLYWLRHATSHARQQHPGAAYRYRVWERRNVASVVAHA